MAKRICDLDGCDNKHVAEGLCAKHYQRLQKTGSTDDPVRLTADERREHARAATRRHYAAHSDQVRARARERYADNREAENARSRAWRLANPERFAELQRAWREANREHVAELYRQWVADNPERIRDIWAAKSARRRGQMAASRVGIIEYAKILTEHGMRCHICDEGIDAMSDLDFDHVIPLARGGTHTTGNIRPSHRTCNRRKGASLPAA